MVHSDVSSEKSFRLFLLELSCLLKEFVDLKKTIKNMNLSIDPSNPGELIQETDKDMNKRSSILPIQLINFVSLLSINQD